MRLRLPILLAVVALLAAPAQAGPEELSRRGWALWRQGPDAEYREILDTAREVMAGMPHSTGNILATNLVRLALERGPLRSDEDWDLAMRLRKRILDEIDDGNGQVYLSDLKTAYPEQAGVFLRDRAWLSAAIGSADHAAELYYSALLRNPSDVEATLGLVRARLRRGRADRALEACDASIRHTGSARVHFARGSLLWRHLRDANAAREALRAARKAAAELPDSERDAFLALVAVEEEALRATVERAAGVREHLAFLDRSLVAIGCAWLLLLAGGGWYARRRGWI